MDIILIRIRLIPYTISYGGRSLLQVKPITSIYTVFIRICVCIFTTTITQRRIEQINISRNRKQLRRS